MDIKLARETQKSLNIMITNQLVNDDDLIRIIELLRDISKDKLRKVDKNGPY